MSLQCVIVGSGRLAAYLLDNLPKTGAGRDSPVDSVAGWDSFQKKDGGNVVVVHAGSGRQLPEVVAFCQRQKAALIQVSSGMDYESILVQPMTFVLVEAPNLSIPVIKLLHILQNNGHLFKGYETHITESHQARKTTLPATAREMADSLGIPTAKIASIRDPAVQNRELHIAEQYLDRHAKHLIEIREGSCTIRIETEVLGYESYLHGIVSLTRAIERLDKRRYSVTDLVEMGVI